MNKIDLSHETTSNIAYVLSGIYGLTVDVWLGSTIILLGLASGYSHATKNWQPDWLAMWLVFSSVLINNPVMATLLAVVLYLFDYVVLKKLDIKILGFEMGYIQLGLLFALGAIFLIPKVGVFAVIAYVLTFVVALYIRPQKPIGHIIWHYLTALGLIFLLYIL